MFSKKLAALTAASLIVAGTPAAAQSAQSLSLTPSARAGAEVSSANELAGGGFWAAVLGVALLAAFVLVVIEDEDEDLPESP